jgi:hypothetical protein
MVVVVGVSGGGGMLVIGDSGGGDGGWWEKLLQLLWIGGIYQFRSPAAKNQVPSFSRRNKERRMSGAPSEATHIRRWLIL